MLYDAGGVRYVTVRYGTIRWDAASFGVAGGEAVLCDSVRCGVEYRGVVTCLTRLCGLGLCGAVWCGAIGMTLYAAAVCTLVLGIPWAWVEKRKLSPQRGLGRCGFVGICGVRYGVGLCWTVRCDQVRAAVQFGLAWFSMPGSTNLDAVR